MMKNNNITHQCVMHKAQNIHFEQPIIEDFIHCINRQFVIGRYSTDLILNMDETNVNVDPSLSRIGERSVNACINRHSGWCTATLALLVTINQTVTLLLFHFELSQDCCVE
jgi:ATP/maltotriose-dependent transcriptional regulator MalT